MLTIFQFVLPLITLAATPMKFTYVPSEAEYVYCNHKQIRDLPDWSVECDNGKKYTAHIIVRGANRASTPQTTLEILYWVTEPGDTPQSVHKFHSTTALINMKEKSSLHSMVIFQGIENDQASLKLELNLE